METMKTKRQVCPICGGGHFNFLFNLPKIPVWINILSGSEAAAKSSPTGIQHLVQCEHCGFVFNSEFEPEKVVYDTGYHAERGHSGYYLQHIHHVVDLIESAKPLKGLRVLEVACGGGEFLAEVAKRGPKEVTGVDPSAPETSEEPLQLHKALFDEAYLNQMACPADVLINRHMIEHILNPLDMLVRFHQALADDGLLYLETPRLDWILENRTFFDFPYEHCAYYSDLFITRLLKYAGFEITAVENSYDGQYFSICAKKCTPQASLTPVSEEEQFQIQQSFSALTRSYSKLNRPESLQRFYEETLKSGRPDPGVSSGIYLWGAAAKGVMCANLLDQWPIAGLIDKNPHKQGKFIPGTGHLVLAPSQIKAGAVKAVIVENDVYFSEIHRDVSQIDPRISVISLSSLL